MKKLAVYILVPSLIVGSCGAGVYVYQKNKQANTYVKVVPVSSISTSDYGSDMYMYGQVVNNPANKCYDLTENFRGLSEKRRQGKYW